MCIVVDVAGVPLECVECRFLLVANGDETCKGHGGVSEWFSKTTKPAAVVTVEAVTKPSARVDVRRTTGPLIGLTRDQVIAELGRPGLISGPTWYFDTPMASVRLIFSSEKVGEVVAPEGFDLDALRAARANVRKIAPTQLPTPPQPPEGAIALCSDGSYVISVHKSGLCFGHGGVRQTLKD
jgi:hypothetical protein